MFYRALTLWGRCPGLTSLLTWITARRASGTADHVRSLDDMFFFCFFDHPVLPLGDPFLGSGTEGVDDLCFHKYGEFFPPPSNWDLDLGAGILSEDLSLKTGIWASRLEFGPQDWDLRGGGGGENPPYV